MCDHLWDAGVHMDYKAHAHAICTPLSPLLQATTGGLQHFECCSIFMLHAFCVARVLVFSGASIVAVALFHYDWGPAKVCHANTHLRASCLKLLAITAQYCCQGMPFERMPVDLLRLPAAVTNLGCVGKPDHV
jgi:hypothetical protein